jgi:hypothetical protein
MNIQYRIFITMTCHPEDTSEGSAKLIEGKEKCLLKKARCSKNRFNQSSTPYRFRIKSGMTKSGSIFIAKKISL